MASSSHANIAKHTHRKTVCCCTPGGITPVSLCLHPFIPHSQCESTTLHINERAKKLHSHPVEKEKLVYVQIRCGGVEVSEERIQKRRASPYRSRTSDRCTVEHDATVKESEEVLNVICDLKMCSGFVKEH